MRKIFIHVALAIVQGTSFANSIVPPVTENGVIRTAETYHLLVKSEQLAQQLLEKINNVPAPARLEKFKELARKNTVDLASRSSGGNLGKVYIGEMVKPFEDAIFNGKPQTVIGPIKTYFGWHLAYVTSTQEEPASPLCLSSLNRSISNSNEQEKTGLLLATQKLNRKELFYKIAPILGSSWKGPYYDSQSSALFFKNGAATNQGEVNLLEMHMEYEVARLQVQDKPISCVRSARDYWAFKCNENTMSHIGRIEYEGRGAMGAEVGTKTPLDKLAYRPVNEATAEGQMRDIACGASK
jgi:PPIC-type PPIASE domain